MHQKKFQVTLTSTSGLIMHSDDVEWAGSMEQWALQPGNKAKSKAGDDRYPAWRWMGCLYKDSVSDEVIIPSDNLMTMLRDAGKKVPTGKKGGSFKAITQSGITLDDVGWPLMIPSKPGSTTYKKILGSELRHLLTEPDFNKHLAECRKAGFFLFPKRARIGQAKHLRVRPRFDVWTASGTLTVTDESISEAVLQSIFDIAGIYCGLCDWRPGAPASGQWGRFTATVKEI